MHFRTIKTARPDNNSFHGNQLPPSSLAFKLRSRDRARRSRPELPLFAERVLVGFDTGRGLVYARASGWNRVYLLWTFRNFRSLPQKVLNPKQLELIESLYRGASVKPAHEFDEYTVIGTVEKFSLSSRLPVPAVADSEPLYARFAFPRITGALVAIIAILAWRQLRAQPISVARTIEPAAVAQQSSDQGSAIAQGVSPSTVEPAANPDHLPLSTTQVATAAETKTTAIRTASVPQPTASLLPRASVVSGKRQPSDQVASARRIGTDLRGTRADLPRMQIAGRPQKLVYPVCPETSVRGKVSLHAVVGYDGAVSQVKVLTGDRVLAAAAIEAVRQWRYQPFSSDALRLERETNITVSFISSEVVAISFPDSALVSR